MKPRFLVAIAHGLSDSLFGSAPDAVASILADVITASLGLPKSADTPQDSPVAVLERAKGDLTRALEAIGKLQTDAAESQSRISLLRDQIGQLESDRAAAEKMLTVPREAVERLIGGALSRGRARGLVEGTVLGLITGVLSSLFVWWLTKQ